jgi:hypothetical protein
MEIPKLKAPLPPGAAVGLGPPSLYHTDMGTAIEHRLETTGFGMVAVASPVRT